MSVFQQIRDAAAAVLSLSRHVELDPGALKVLAEKLRDTVGELPQPDPGLMATADPALRVRFIVTLDAVNFGSGWFPLLRKRPGCSGYFTVANALEENFASRGGWSAAELSTLDASDCARIFGQSGEGVHPDVQQLMGFFARSLNDLGSYVTAHFGGDFSELIASAEQSAEQLVERLCEMPMYRDVARYHDFDLPFYKRAQITAMDLAVAFGGRGPGEFRDLEQLTMFADNLVPHVLRCEGALAYEPELARRIDQGELLLAGSREEMEIRAAGVCAVERMTDWIRARGGRASACRLDYALWRRGQRPEIKAHPRHRCRSIYY